VNLLIVTKDGNKVKTIEWRSFQFIFLNSKYAKAQGIIVHPINGTNMLRNSFNVEISTKLLKFKGGSEVIKKPYLSYEY